MESQKINLKCLICHDLFTLHANIRTTPCGHLFHYDCLAEWLRRSRTCPQCRCKTTRKSIRKIYLSVEENAETLDIEKLLNEKYETARKQTVGLLEEIKTQEHKTRVLESATHALKEEIAYFKSKSKDCDKLEEEIGRLKGQLRDMEHVQKKQEIEAHKHCESEIKRNDDDLARKSKTESPNPLNTSIRRIIPPLPKLSQLKNKSTNRDMSPSIPVKVQTVKDSDSPNFQPQISVVDYPQAWQLPQISSSASTVTNNELIFKQPSVQLIDLKRHSTQGSNHGLGGCANEELSQSPQPQKINLKRPKPSSTITSAKIRKLAPQKK